MARQSPLLGAIGDWPQAIEDVRLWPVKGTGDLPFVQAAKDAKAARESEERNRLLYVALTRPRDRLYIAGYAGAKDPTPECWYQPDRGRADAWHDRV